MLVYKLIHGAGRKIENEMNKFLSETKLGLEDIKFSTSVSQGTILVSIIYEVK